MLATQPYLSADWKFLIFFYFFTPFVFWFSFLSIRLGGACMYVWGAWLSWVISYLESRFKMAKNDCTPNILTYTRMRAHLQLAILFINSIFYFILSLKSIFFSSHFRKIGKCPTKTQSKSTTTASKFHLLWDGDWIFLFSLPPNKQIQSTKSPPFYPQFEKTPTHTQTHWNRIDQPNKNHMRSVLYFCYFLLLLYRCHRQRGRRQRRRRTHFFKLFNFIYTIWLL